MNEYTICKTRKGDYVVKIQGDRLAGRFQTEPEAVTFVDQKRADEAAEAERNRAFHAAQSAFNDIVPDLNRAQIRWQNWRSWFYNELQHAERKTAQHADAIDRLPNHDSPSFEKQERYLTQGMEEGANARDLYYGMISPMDTRIKAARRAHDVEVLTATLSEAEPLIEQMDKFFTSIARPEEYKRPVGRPPAAGSTRQVPVSITMPPEYKAWLQSRGDVSEQVRTMIEHNMQEADNA